MKLFMFFILMAFGCDNADERKDPPQGAAPIDNGEANPATTGGGSGSGGSTATGGDTGFTDDAEEITVTAGEGSETGEDTSGETGGEADGEATGETTGEESPPSLEMKYSLYVPAVYKEYSGWMSSYNLVSVGNKSATAEASYFKNNDAKTFKDLTVATNLARGVYLGTKSEDITIKADEWASLKVKSNRPLGGYVNMSKTYTEGDQTVTTASAYRVFDSSYGSKKLYFPMITANYADKWSSSWAVQNISDKTANITAEYHFKTDAWQKKTKNFTVKPNKTMNIMPVYDPEKFMEGKIGAVVITSDVNIVGFSNMGQKAPNHQSMAYSGIPVESAAKVLYFSEANKGLPDSPSTLDSNVFIQNAGNVDTRVKATYYYRDGGQVVVETDVIKPNQVANQYLPSVGDFKAGGSASVKLEALNPEGKIAAVITTHQKQNSYARAVSSAGHHKLSSTLVFPHVFYGYSSWTSSFIVQNAGSSEVTPKATIYWDTNEGVKSANITLKALEPGRSDIRHINNVGADVPQDKPFTVVITGPEGSKINGKVYHYNADKKMATGTRGISVADDQVDFDDR